VQALLCTLLDAEQCASALDDRRRSLQENARGQAEAKNKQAQLTRAVENDAEVVGQFEGMQRSQAARMGRIPQARLPYGLVGSSGRMQFAGAWRGTERTNELAEQAQSNSDAMLEQTRATLQRHQDELSACKAEISALQGQQRTLNKEVSFHERQLDMCVAQLKDSGIRNQRGSERYDCRGLPQRLALDKAVFVALDHIIDAVSRLRKVNRGFTDRPGDAFGAY
jgi:hypothetical protein